MYSAHEVRVLHLEVSSRCNARCPMCGRNQNGGAQTPGLNATDLTLAQVQKLLPSDFLSQLNRIFLCGNLGDPITAPDLLSILRYFKEINPKMHLGLHTNGGARPESFWRELAPLMEYVRFGIDGLADTNHLYRQGINWPTLERNLRAFTQAGGKAHWDYLAFEHNDHQIEAAENFSKELGFLSFRVKATGRFLDTSTGSIKDSWEVHDLSGNVSHALRPSRRVENEGFEVVQSLRGDYRDFLGGCEIDCRVLPDKMVYLSADGLLAPCCWLAGEALHSPKGFGLGQLLRQEGYDWKDLSLYEKHPHDVINGPVFQKLLPQGWSKGSVDSQRLFTCARVCNKEVDAFGQQFKNKMNTATR